MKNFLPYFIFVIYLLAYNNAAAQNITVKGTVTDTTGGALPGVTIKIKNTNQGITTNQKGEYQLNNVSGTDTLEFSMISFLSQTVAIANRKQINVMLRPYNGQLEEIVVVGYGVQKKINVTGAISTVTSKDLNQAPALDVTNALAGRLPGLIVQQSSGEPGFTNSSLNIRGFGAPLVIIDGVEAPIGNLDPKEIESVSVLKDASAAVYGARAGNGVILVTTKRGSSGKPTVQLTSTYSLQTITVAPKTLNAGQYAEIIREAELNSGTPETGLRFTQEEVDKYKQGTAPGYQGADWYSAIMDKYSPLLQTGLSVSGGSEKIKYYTFLGLTDQTGMYKSGDNKFRRYNLRSNIDGQISRDLSVSMDISLSNSTVKSPTRPQGNLWQDFYELQPIYPSSLPDASKIAYAGTVVSTAASVTRDLSGYNDLFANQLQAAISAKYNIPGIRGLYLKGLVNYLENTSERKNWLKAYTMYTYEPTNDTYTPFGSAPVTSLSQSYDKAKSITSQTSVNYENTFGSAHKVSALALMEVTDYSQNYFTAGRGGYLSTSIDQLFAGGGGNQTANGTASQTGRISYVGRVNYAYKEKYLFESTVRYDGSPNFPPNKRWGLFPSVSLGWRINEEPFFKNDVTWIDNLKLRATVSTTGFDGIGQYQYLTGYQFGNTFVSNDVIRQGLTSTGLANPDITWEEMNIYNTGLDFSINKGMIYGSIDGFFRNRRGILASPILTLPNTFGATLPLQNINSMNTRGIEVVIGKKGKIKDLSYDVSGNFSFSRSKWVNFAEPAYTDPDDIKIHQLSGRWTDVAWGYIADGLFTSAEEIAKYPLNQDGQHNATILPGDIKYKDQNGDGILDWKDSAPIGFSNQPQIMFGLNINLQYKNFSLSALFQGAANNDVLLNYGVENFANQKDVVYNERWTEQNNDANAIIPRQYMGGKVNNRYTSSYWLKDASYGRLKVLNIGYDLPAPAMKKIGFSSMRIYFSGTNLFTVSGLSKYNIDPEAPSGIKSGNNYPQQKVYSLGLNVAF